MAAPLSICTKEEQRSVVRSLWAEGLKGVKIHSVYLISMVIICCLSGVCVTGLKC
jgi:hypothetical protein